MSVTHPSTTKCIIVKCAAPVQQAFLFYGPSLLHLLPKFSVTFTFAKTGTDFGNSAQVLHEFFRKFLIFRKGLTVFYSLKVYEIAMSVGFFITNLYSIHSALNNIIFTKNGRFDGF